MLSSMLRSEEKDDDSTRRAGADDVMVMCSTFSPLPGSDSGSHLQFEHWTNPTSLLAPELIYLFRSAILVAQTISVLVLCFKLQVYILKVVLYTCRMQRVFRPHSPTMYLTYPSFLTEKSRRWGRAVVHTVGSGKHLWQRPWTTGFPPAYRHARGSYSLTHHHPLRRARSAIYFTSNVSI